MGSAKRVGGKAQSKLRPNSPSYSEPSESDVELSNHQNGSRKRRRLAAEDGAESEPDTTSESASDQESVPEPAATTSAPISAVSRVKVKPTGPIPGPTTVNDSVPTPLGSSDKTSFASINVAPWLIASLSSLEIKRPTGIQKACIPEILKGRDCIGGSRTGTGKTVAFSVPILQKWAEDPMGIFGLIIT
jgi:ATP-dependent RNA helicase DDX49/DBP8